MSEPITQAPLPEGWQPLSARRPLVGREPDAVVPGGEPAETTARQTVTAAVLAGLTASPPGAPAAASRTRQAALAARSSAAVGQALAALARSVRTTLHVDDVDRGSDAGLDDAAAGGCAVTLPLDLGPHPAWLLPGAAAGQGADGTAVKPAAGAKSAAGSARRDPRLPPPSLASTTAIVRVRAPQRVRRGARPRHGSMLRIASWGVALVCTLALASAYWLIAAPPPPEDDPQRTAGTPPDGR